MSVLLDTHGGDCPFFVDFFFFPGSSIMVREDFLRLGNILVVSMFQKSRSDLKTGGLGYEGPLFP